MNFSTSTIAVLSITAIIFHGTNAAVSASPMVNGGIRQFGQTVFSQPPGKYSDFLGHFDLKMVQLSKDGRRMAVGAPNLSSASGLDDDIDNNRGAVFVYERDEVPRDSVDSAEWRLIFRLLSKEGEGMGDSLALSDDGKKLAVRRYDDLKRDVQVFEWKDDEDTFVLMGQHINACGNDRKKDGKTLALGTTDEFSWFGASDWIAVSCESHNNFRGKVEVFRFDTEGQHARDQWFPFATIEGEDDGARLGWSTSFGSSNGENIQLAISSPNFDEKRGMVQVFEVNRFRNATELVGSALVGETEGEQFGFSVAMATATSALAVGSPRNPGGGEERGSVTVFGVTDSIDGDWEMLGEPLTGTDDNDRFGRSVAITQDAGRLAASSIHHNHQKGQAILFERDVAFGYTPVQEIVGESNLDRWGYSVSLNEFGSMVAAVSSRAEWLGHKSVGSAQVFLDDSPFCSKPLYNQVIEDQFLARNLCRDTDGSIFTDETECLLSKCEWVEDLPTSAPTTSPMAAPTTGEEEGPPTPVVQVAMGAGLVMVLGLAVLGLYCCVKMRSYCKNNKNTAESGEEEAKSAPATTGKAETEAVSGEDMV